MNLKLSPIPINRIPGGSDSKESTWNAGDLGSISGLGRSPGEGIHNPLQYSCLENSMDRGVLVGYSPYRCKELDMTEMAPHSSVLAWRIPGTGEPGGLPSMGSHRFRHEWSDLAAATEQLTLALSHQLAFPSDPASILQNLHCAEPVLVI